MITLKEFVLRNSDFRFFSDYASDTLTQQLEALTKSIIISELPQSQTHPIPKTLLRYAEYLTEDHNKLIDELIKSLQFQFQKDHTIKNVLIEGYVDISSLRNSSRTDTSWICPGLNSSVQLLKSPEFVIIHSVLGTPKFLHLLINCSAFANEMKLKLWGDVKVRNYKNVLKDDGTIFIQSILFKNDRATLSSNPLPDKSIKALSRIFSVDFEERKNIPKGLRKLNLVLKSMILNHKAKQLNYPYVLDSICPSPTKEQMKNMNNFELATNKKRMVKFVLTILQMIIPDELLGCNHNFHVFCSNLSQILFAQCFEKFQLDELIKGVKITEIPWLCNSGGFKKQNKSGFREQTLKLRKVFKWLVCSVTFKLISAFFYVTTKSQSVGLLFYRREIWKNISQSFQHKYFHSHINGTPAPSFNGIGKFTENEDYIGLMRLLPKPNDFRLIVVPYRGKRFGEFDYLNYLTKEVKILSKVLNGKRETNSLGSVDQLCLLLSQYKHDLKELNDGDIPKIHALKFDIKHAYDSLPISVIRSCVNELFPDENEIFYLHEFRNITTKAMGSKRTKLSSSKGIRLIDPLASVSNGKTVVSKENKVTKINKTDIIKLVEAQLAHNALFFNGDTYHRTDGLFQGFPLSATFCNLVYDKVLLHLEKLVPTQEFISTRIIRLADDFLILTDSLNTFINFQKLIARPLPPFNLKLNRLKTVKSTTELIFLGYHINLLNLTVSKPCEKYDSTPILNCNSFKLLFDKLIWVFESRVNRFSLFRLPSEDVVEKENVLLNLKELGKCLAIKFIKSYKIIKKKDKLTEMAMNKFLDRLEEIVWRKYNIVEWGDVLSKEFWDGFNGKVVFN